MKTRRFTFLSQPCVPRRIFITAKNFHIAEWRSNRQLRGPHKPEVAGSSPASATISEKGPYDEQNKTLQVGDRRAGRHIVGVEQCSTAPPRLPQVLSEPGALRSGPVHLLHGELDTRRPYRGGCHLRLPCTLSRVVPRSQDSIEPDNPGTEDFVVCVQGGKHRGCKTSSRHRRPDSYKKAPVRSSILRLSVWMAGVRMFWRMDGGPSSEHGASVRKVCRARTSGQVQARLRMVHRRA